MKMRRGLWMAGALVLAGCSLQTPYPSRALYTLSAGARGGDAATAPAGAGAVHKDVVLRVRKLMAAAPYNTTSFVYRTAPNKVKLDYYNTFAALPTELLTTDLVRWMQDGHLFSAVTDAGSGVEHQWALEGRLQELSVDTSGGKAEAVMTLQVLVWNEGAAGNALLIDKTYTERGAMAGVDAAGAAAAWGVDCRAIFGRVEKDLAAVP